MPRLTRIGLAVLACSTPGMVPAQGRATIEIATHSPLAFKQAPRGEGIRLGAQRETPRLRGSAARWIDPEGHLDTPGRPIVAYRSTHSPGDAAQAQTGPNTGR